MFMNWAWKSYKIYGEETDTQVVWSNSPHRIQQKLAGISEIVYWAEKRETSSLLSLRDNLGEGRGGRVVALKWPSI